MNALRLLVLSLVVVFLLVLILLLIVLLLLLILRPVLVIFLALVFLSILLLAVVALVLLLIAALLLATDALDESDRAHARQPRAVRVVAGSWCELGDALVRLGCGCELCEVVEVDLAVG